MNAMSRTVLIAILLASTVWAQPPTAPPQRRWPIPGAPNGPNPGRPGLPQVNADPLTSPPRETAAAPIDLSGSWKGVYCPDLTVVVVDLNLTADDAKRKLTGELRYKTIPPAGTRARPEEGSWKVAGVVDPGARTVVLAPQGVIPPPAFGVFIRPERMSAVYCIGRGELAGQFVPPFGPGPDMPYFLLARADAAGKVKALTEHAAAKQPVLRASGSPPSDEAIAKWAARYTEEYGKNAPMQMVDKIGVQSMPLLNDATFKPVFGESYDTIDYGKLAAAMHRLGGVVAGGGGVLSSRPDPAFVREHGYIQYIVAPTPDRVVSAAAMRAIDAWESETLAHFRSDPPVASAFDDLAAMQKAVQERVVYAWPSDKKGTDEAFEQIKTHLGSSALAANAERAVAGASGMAGARALASWAADNAAMLKYAAAADRDAAQQRIDAGLDKLLEGLLAEPVARLDKLGTGTGALRDGAAWYRSVVSQFGFAGQRPPVQKAVEKLSARREQDMTTGFEQGLHRITASKTTDEIDAFFAGDLSVPGDESKKLYGALADAGRKRKAEIQQDFAMSLFSEQETEWMDRPGHIDLKKGEEKAPSAESIRLAIVRGYAFGTGTMIDAHSARHVTRMRALGIPYPAIVRMSDEHLEAFMPAKDGKGFDCNYTILMQMTIPPNNVLAGFDPVVRKGIDEQTKMINRLLQAAAGATCSGNFRLYEDGWGMTKLRENGAAEVAIDEILKSR